MNPEDFQKKVSITDSSLAVEMEIKCGGSDDGSTSSTVGSGIASQTLVLLRSLLEIQQRRAQAYAKLKRFDRLEQILSRNVMLLVRVMFNLINLHNQTSLVALVSLNFVTVLAIC